MLVRRLLMLALILFLVFGLSFGYFATLNTSVTSLHLGLYSFSAIPVFMIVLATLGVGVVISSMVYVIKFFGISRAHRKIERDLNETQNKIAQLLKDNHKLELENAKLTESHGDEEIADDNAL